MLALHAPKQIKLLSIPFAASYSASREKFKVWQASIPEEGTPLQIGLAKFEFKERDFGENSQPS